MIAFLILHLEFANAVVSCAPRETLTGPSKAVVDHYIKAHDYDDPDRRTAEEYAKEHKGETKESVERRYAPTGDLDCPGGDSQANVTISNNIIVTAAHSIFRGKNCGAKNDAKKCKFTTDLDGKRETYEIDTMMFTGWDCGRYDRKTGSDWAILRLKKSVDSRIKPYGINRKASADLFAGDPVTSVGKSIDFPRLGSKLSEQPRHYGDCRARFKYNYDQNSTVSTNCDGDRRSSGGPLLTQGDDPILLGVHEALILGGGKDCPKVDPNKRSGKWSECWGSTVTLTSGDFMDSLEAIESSFTGSLKK